MRTQHVETYQFRNGSWYAVTTDLCRSTHAFGATEAEALASLCDELVQKLEEEAAFDQVLT